MSTLGHKEKRHCVQCNRDITESKMDHTLRHHPLRIVGIVCVVIALALGIAMVAL